MDVPVVAGMISTVLFAISTLPMLHKAARTKDLRSYSGGNIAMSNVGNAVHSVYVFSLPAGPIWILHCFYIVAAGLMLLWYLRYGRRADNRHNRISPASLIQTRSAGTHLPSPPDTRVGSVNAFRRSASE